MALTIATSTTVLPYWMDVTSTFLLVKWLTQPATDRSVIGSHLSDKVRRTAGGPVHRTVSDRRERRNGPVGVRSVRSEPGKTWLPDPRVRVKNGFPRGSGIPQSTSMYVNARYDCCAVNQCIRLVASTYVNDSVWILLTKHTLGIAFELVKCASLKVLNTDPLCCYNPPSFGCQIDTCLVCKCRNYCDKRFASSELSGFCKW